MSARAKFAKGRENVPFGCRPLDVLLIEILDLDKAEQVNLIFGAVGDQLENDQVLGGGNADLPTAHGHCALDEGALEVGLGSLNLEEDGPFRVIEAKEVRTRRQVVAEALPAGEAGFEQGALPPPEERQGILGCDGQGR